MVPIFKRGAAFKPGKYRGVHLTTVLSKVAEKMIALQLTPFLQRQAFGSNQWAFSTGLSARDLVSMLIMSWLLAICTGKKIGAYLSDISGAFDRVFEPYILAKLHACEEDAIFLNFLDAYLAPRKGQVVVQGAFQIALKSPTVSFREPYWAHRCGTRSLQMCPPRQIPLEVARLCLLTILTFFKNSIGY